MPQSTLSNESVEAFVIRKIGELQKFAEQENYKVDLEISREDIRKTIDSTTTGGGALYVAQGRQNNLFSGRNILIVLIALVAYVFYN